MNPKTKKAFLYIFYMAITIAILVFILSMNDIDDIFKALKTADYKNVLIAVFLCLIYFALYPLSLCILAKAKKVEAPMKDVYLVGTTEHFFNGITPFATGGQPFEAYALSKSNVKYSMSTGLLVMNFLIYMIVNNLFSLASLFYFHLFATNTTITVIAIIGFSMNFIVLICAILLGTSKVAKDFIIWCMKMLAKIKFLRRFLESKMQSFNEYVDQSQVAFKDLCKHKWAFVISLFTKILTMLAYHVLTFFILRALHVNVGLDQLFFVICGSSFAVTMFVFIPTPGSSGGIEMAFSIVFASIAGSALSSVSYGGMLIWRLITYYMVILLSFLCFILLEIVIKIRSKKQALFNKETSLK